MLVLVEEWHLHVLTGGGSKLPTGGSVDRLLLLVTAHAYQEEQAGDDQWYSDTGDEDIQYLLLHVFRGLWS